MKRLAEIVRDPGLLGRLWPVAIVTAWAFWLVWPAPIGRMPLSADHPVHLTRAWMYGQTVASGQLRGWSSIWFFGTPIGELYPVLGDALVLAIRGLTLGLADWPTAYALAFTVAFASPGWAMLRVGSVLRLGPWPGLLAALLLSADVGAYREGGWIYTVDYGVWPQSLSTALTWLGLGELVRWLEPEASPVGARRSMVGAIVACSGAVLAHPIAMVVLALTVPLVVLTLGLGGGRSLRAGLVAGMLLGALTFGLAAWWLLPMLEHRAWMASYGWAWLPFDVVLPRVARGQWTQSMPPLVGYTIAAGLALIAWTGSRPARALALAGLGCWAFASVDVVWGLRLDRLSAGFLHLQYQRFVIAAKPGLFLCVGFLVGWVARQAPLGSSAVARRWRALAAFGLGAGILGAQVQAFAKDPNVRPIVTTRDPADPDLDRAYRALAVWLGERWTERADFWRVTVQADRNAHWFMDLPVRTGGVPLFKQGFTPGDNFVHKPERGSPSVLDAARVRYEIVRAAHPPRHVEVSFGALHVVRRAPTRPAAWLQGEGRVHVVQDDPAGEGIRVRVEGTAGPTRLVFGVAGYPRFELLGPDGPLDWVEVPVTGRGAALDPATGRSGPPRGGKARGDDGTEPTLLAADVVDGEYRLRYRPRRSRDAWAGLLSLATAAALLWLAWPGRVGRWQWISRRLDRLAHPLLVACVVAVVLGWLVVQVRVSAREERQHAFGWPQRSFVAADTRFFKTDMLLRPAVVPRSRSAKARFDRVPAGARLEGWVALDDDAAQLRRGGTWRLTLETRGPAGWTTRVQRTVAHRPGRQPFSLPAAAEPRDVRISLDAEGSYPPPVGFDWRLRGGHG